MKLLFFLLVCFLIESVFPLQEPRLVQEKDSLIPRLLPTNRVQLAAKDGMGDDEQKPRGR